MFVIAKVWLVGNQGYAILNLKIYTCLECQYYEENMFGSCAAIWAGMYSLVMFLIGKVILDDFANALLFSVAYILTGVEAIVILGIMIKNLIKGKKIYIRNNQGFVM